MNNYVPGFSNHLRYLAEGGAASPTEEPVVAEPVASGYPAMPADYAARASANARRAFDQAASRSFGARGELSRDLDRIDTTTDFNYSPEAAQYLYDVGRYPVENTQYDLTPMNLMKVDPQTGAPMPYTSGQLEGYAQQPLADQFYANFNYSDPKGKGWDVGNLQFAPNQQYRLIDRKTGDVVYTGSGYEAGKSISDLAKGMFDKSGQQANWVIQEAAPGSDQWTQRYEHVPDVNGFTTWLKMVAPMLGAGILAPALGLGGTLGTAAGSALGTAGAGIAAGDSIGDILKNAAISGATAYAGGELFNRLGGGAPTGGTGGPGVTVDDFVSMGVSPGTASNIVGGLGGALPTDIVVTGARNAGALAGLGGALSTAAPALTTGPEPRRPDYGDRMEEQPGDEIVVEGTRPISPVTPVPPLSLGEVMTLPPTTLAPDTGTITEPATVQPEARPSGGLDLVDYLRLAGLASSTLGKLFGGGGGGGSNFRVPGGMGALHPSFGGSLPPPNLPGLGGGAGSGPRSPSELGAQGLRSPQDYYRYGYGPEQSFFNYVPQSTPNTSQAYTGYAKGGFAVEGPGDGREDKIPAMLSDGEYVIDAETVALLGNGSNKAGADMLDKFRVNVRKHKGRELSRGEFSKNAKRPEQYMAGGRSK